MKPVSHLAPFTCIPVQYTHPQVRPVSMQLQQLVSSQEVPAKWWAMVGSNKYLPRSTRKRNQVNTQERSALSTSVKAFDPKRASTHCNVKMRRLEVSSCWNMITLRPLSKCHTKFLQLALVHYTVAVQWVKKERPKHFLFVYGTKILNWDSPCTIHQCMLTGVHPHILTLCGLTNPEDGQCGSVPKQNLGLRIRQSSTFESRSQMFSELRIRLSHCNIRYL